MGTIRGGGGVRAASASTIEIDWYWRGARCRERLKLPPTPANLRFARNLLGEIATAIARGTFDYVKTFPRSPRARRMAPNPAALVTVGKKLDDWLKAKKPSLEHSTYVEYERAVRCQLDPAFGKLMLCDFERHHVRAWVADRASGAKYLNNTLSPLRQMLTEALDDRLISVNPLRDYSVKRAGGRRKEIDPFSPGEMKAIIEAMPEGQVRNLVQFAFWSGLRPSEWIALKWGAVDFEARTVRVTAAFVRGKEKVTKTAAGTRTVKLLEPAWDALRAQRKHTLLAGGVVFQNPRMARAWASDKAFREHDWTPALAKAGVRYRYPAQTRHTYASLLLSAGEPVMWVAQQLGHHDWTVTARTYARWIPSAVPDAGSKALAVWNRKS